MKTKTVYICTGKDCRKQTQFQKFLGARLAETFELKTVRCQKICKSAVVGFVHSDQLIWIRKLKSNKDGEALLDALDGKKLPKRIKARLVKKRTNRLRD